MYQDSALQSFEDHKRENAQFTHSLDLSNFTLPPCDQFEAFRSAYQGVMDVSVVPGGPQSFPARQTVWGLGRLAFMRTRLPGEKHAHRQKHLKTCVLDHWYVSLPFRSPKFSEWRDAVPELHCLATPFDRETNHDGILTLFIPHDLFASTAGLDRMLDVRLEGGLGKLLADYLFLLDRSLADLQSAEIPYIAEATRSLVAVCLAPSQDRLMEAQTPVDATLLSRARRIIDGRLADRNLTSESLCLALGVSRSRLYRIFEPLGGVASYIRKQRLLRTRNALSDIADTRPISRIAEQWGFVDASAYSRTFRHEFGISPKQARDIGWASDGFVVAQQCQVRYDGAQSLYQLLRTVDGTRSGLGSAAQTTLPAATR
jgi:AraC-like DNA-binding protein